MKLRGHKTPLPVAQIQDASARRLRCYRTAWLIKHKIMKVMRQREEGRQLTGRIQMDDAYLGGERHGGTAGRGSEGSWPAPWRAASALRFAS